MTGFLLLLLNANWAWLVIESASSRMINFTPFLGWKEQQEGVSWFLSRDLPCLTEVGGACECLDLVSYDVDTPLVRRVELEEGGGGDRDCKALHCYCIMLLRAPFACSSFRTVVSRGPRSEMSFLRKCNALFPHSPWKNGWVSHPPLTCAGRPVEEKVR